MSVRLISGTVPVVFKAARNEMYVFMKRHHFDSAIAGRSLVPADLSSGPNQRGEEREGETDIERKRERERERG